jgi:hypothetical protein
LSVGMLTSCWFRERNATVSWSSVMVAGIAFLPLLLPRTLVVELSPVTAFNEARAAVYNAGPGKYWMTLGVTQLMSWCALGRASWIAPYCWQEKAAVYATPAWRRPGKARAMRRSERAKMLDENPVYWLATRSLGNPVWLLAAPIAVASVSVLMVIGVAADVLGVRRALEILPFLMFLFMVVNFLMKLQVARVSCRFFAEAKKNNAMEMLLSTPLTVEKIVEGQWLGLRRYFTRTMLITFGLEILGLFLVAVADGATWRRDGSDILGEFGVIFGGGWVYSLYYVYDAFGVAWAGIWFGLSAKSEAAAVNKTMLLAIALPTFSMVLCWVGLPIIIGAPLFWISWGRSKVTLEFRKIAAQRYEAPKEGWLPGVDV